MKVARLCVVCKVKEVISGFYFLHRLIIYHNKIFKSKTQTKSRGNLLIFTTLCTKLITVKYCPPLNHKLVQLFHFITDIMKLHQAQRTI